MRGSLGRWSAPAWLTALVALAVATAAASVALLPPKKASTRVVTTGGSGPFASSTGRGRVGAHSGAAHGARTVRRVVGPAPSSAGLECAAGRNGGATDVGVTGTSIKLGATVVDSGIGASFLADARYGMIAVKDAVNAAGGICGRRLDLTLVDDGWDFQRGGEYLRSLVEDQKVFALAVVPSSEGLKNVSDAGFLDAHRVPVIGTDGMLIDQYEDPYIWPVAASTISTMHIMAEHAFDHFHARHMAIVYEDTYHFGIEGAYAFNAAVKRLTGHDVPGYSNPLSSPKCQERFCGISAGAASYSTEIQQFNNACLQPPKCDFIALLLEPATALTWMKGGALNPSYGIHMGGVQPLFTRDFAEECGETCNGLWLWTGYDPPVSGYLGRGAVSKYVHDIQATSSSADYNNTFVEGAYIGMSLLVKALQTVGPDLTRAKLKDVLDHLSFDSGLTAPLAWSPGDHFANVEMRAFSIQFKDRFAGWRDERISSRDPWVGRDTP